MILRDSAERASHARTGKPPVVPGFVAAVVAAGQTGVHVQRDGGDSPAQKLRANFETWALGS